MPPSAQEPALGCQPWAAGHRQQLKDLAAGGGARAGQDTALLRAWFVGGGLGDGKMLGKAIFVVDIL